MKIRIVFESRKNCKQEWDCSVSESEAYRKQNDSLMEWRKSHKIKRYVIPLLKTGSVFIAVYLFVSYIMPSVFHRFYDTGDISSMLQWVLLSILAFIALLSLSFKLINYLLRKFDLEGPAVKEPPLIKATALKYNQFQLIQSLMNSEENAPIAIALALSYGFKSVQNQDKTADSNCATLDFDNEKVLISA